jgi:hypothetical protein
VKFGPWRPRHPNSNIPACGDEFCIERAAPRRDDLVVDPDRRGVGRRQAQGFRGEPAGQAEGQGADQQNTDGHGIQFGGQAQRASFHNDIPPYFYDAMSVEGLALKINA